MVTNAMMSPTDFENILDTYSGQEVTRTPITKTTDPYSGDETLTDGSPVTIKVHFVRSNDKYEYDKMGLTEKGDAIMLARIADAVKKNDKITHQSKTYRIRELYDVDGTFVPDASGTTKVYTVCNLFSLEE